MKFSESWLREWVNPSVGTEKLVEQLTMAGLEVDAVETVAGDFSGIVVGEIISAEPHPDADKLRVCKVAGAPDGETQVVCGAPNARPGIKVPYALVGAVLPPGEDGKPFKIKKAKLRGVESFGMLCAQTELQAGDDDVGLWELAEDAPVGADLREYLNLEDAVIDVDLTPNRGDCLGVKGLAREVGVLNREPVATLQFDMVDESITDTLSVELNAGEACSRYMGRIIRNVDVSKPSPLWMQEKLRRSGIRSIDAVVDVTNYVLLELGQPMHAFDLTKLEGGIDVRLSEQGETLTLLDGQDITLNNDTLVIADKRGPLAIAGVMGGERSCVTKETTDIFLESAFFHPIAVAGKARAYGLHTDSSHRFERGVDYDGARYALERASALLVDIVGGQAGPIILAENECLPADKTVELRKSRIERGLGFAIPSQEVVEILGRLGLELLSESDERWKFSVPSYRFDIALEADLLEELARIYGYNNLPTTEMRIPVSLPDRTESLSAIDTIVSHLVARDYREAITYSFIEPKLQSLFAPGVKTVELLNPISADMSVMRTSLLPGLVQTLIYNLNRQQTRARLFEKGLRFVRTETGVDQTQALAGLIFGQRDAQSWSSKGEDVDFYDIKGDVESLLAIGGQELTFAHCEEEVLHPGQSANVLINGQKVGIVGTLHPQILKELGLAKSVFVFELDLTSVLGATVPSFSVLSKFPEVSRDLALVVDKTVTAGELQEKIVESAGDYLKNLKVFDLYSGEGIDPQRKSVAFSLTFQHPSRTLNEEEINTSIKGVVDRLSDELNATLR